MGLSPANFALSISFLLRFERKAHVSAGFRKPTARIVGAFVPDLSITSAVGRSWPA